MTDHSNHVRFDLHLTIGSNQQAQVWLDILHEQMRGITTKRLMISTRQTHTRCSTQFVWQCLTASSSMRMSDLMCAESASNPWPERTGKKQFKFGQRVRSSKLVILYSAYPNDVLEVMVHVLQHQVNVRFEVEHLENLHETHADFQA